MCFLKVSEFFLHLRELEIPLENMWIVRHTMLIMSTFFLDLILNVCSVVQSSDDDDDAFHSVKRFSRKLEEKRRSNKELTRNMRKKSFAMENKLNGLL